MFLKLDILPICTDFNIASLPKPADTKGLSELYQEFEADGHYMEHFLSCLRSREAGSRSLGDPYYSYSAVWPSSRRMSYACDHFDEALANFRNLQSVKHWQRGRRKRLVWRGLRFSVEGRNPRDAYQYSLYDDMRAVSFVLRGLGWANSLGRSNLKAIDIRTSGRAFWDVMDLQNYLWGFSRPLDNPCDSDFRLIQRSFTDITRLSFTIIKDSGDRADNFDNTLRHFHVFLCTAEKLEDLTLRLLPVDYGYLGRDMLKLLSKEGNRWAKLRRLDLSVRTNGRSLLTFLTNHASSLRTLILQPCDLTPPQDSWPALLVQARDILSLDSIALSYLEDARWGDLEDAELFIDFEYFPDCFVQYCQIFDGFMQRIYDYVLKITNTQPVWDHRPISKEHLKMCTGCEENEALHSAARPLPM